MVRCSQHWSFWTPAHRLSDGSPAPSTLTKGDGTGEEDADVHKEATYGDSLEDGTLCLPFGAQSFTDRSQTVPASQTTNAITVVALDLSARPLSLLDRTRPRSSDPRLLLRPKRLLTNVRARPRSLLVVAVVAVRPSLSLFASSRRADLDALRQDARLHQSERPPAARSYRRLINLRS